MKCANCDAEIKDGSIYCPVCGKEAQMVNGYDSLEDDFLHSLLREGIKPQKEKQKKVLTTEEQLRIRKQKQIMPVMVTGLIIAILIATGVVLKLFVDYKNDNSYEYQMKMAETEIIDHNYEKAMEHLYRALSIVPSDVESRMDMVKIYLLREETDAAMVLLSEVIRLDDNNVEAYQNLIDIYAEKGQYEQIQKLSELVKDKEVKALFTDYLVANPSIYPEGDTFYDELTVTIFSVDNHAIYYTTDGKNPITDGQRYIDGVGITLHNSGLYTVKAVCKNKNGIYSEVISHSYQIALPEEIKSEETTEEVMEVVE